MEKTHAKVLIVEDDLLLLMVEERMVQRLGFDVVGTANDGEEAISKCKQLHPDLILMDITLRGELDGIETMKIIRETSDTPVIYLSGSSERYTYERANNVGFAGFLVKPVTTGDLKEPILHALENKTSPQKESASDFVKNRNAQDPQFSNYEQDVHF